jgi:predicted AlkP superfamily phosphohydrolase/phosphomutase
MGKVRVLAVGLDGATFKVLDRMFEEGITPFLAKVAMEGAFGELDAFLPTLSPMEWACFYTGKNPGKIGIFGFTYIPDFRGGHPGAIADRTKIKEPSLWGILSGVGLSVGVVNIPLTYPPERIHGFFISGLLTPEGADDYFWPPSIRDLLHGYMVNSQFEAVPDQDIGPDVAQDGLREYTIVRTNTTLKLLSRFDTDFLVVNFKDVDAAQHFFWDDYGRLAQHMRLVDKHVRLLVEHFKPTHTILFSDHGFHESEKYYFFINKWLEKKGYLRFRADPWTRLKIVFMGLGSIALRRLPRLRRLLPGKLRSESTLEGMAVGMVEDGSPFATMWGIFFPKGSSSDRGETLERMQRELTQIKGPTGDDVFLAVYKREELYHGEYLEFFPELVLVPNPVYLINPAYSWALFMKRIDRPYLKGSHKSDNKGIVAIWGDGVRKGFRLHGARIVDLFPTILALYGIKPQDDVDGRIMYEAFEKAARLTLFDREKQHDVNGEPTETYEYTPVQSEKLMEQLRRLGYA